MKKKLITLNFIFCIFMIKANAQHCCSMLAANSDAFATDPAFIRAHLSPTPFTFVPVNGKMISFRSPDGKDAGAFEVIAKDAGNKMIFMFHEWWGLNDYIKQEAEKLSFATGATVIAIDLYDGQVTASQTEASALFSGLTETRARAIISGAIDYAGRESEIQTIGWCLGGKWSLQATLMAGPNARGCVMYYGMPETDKIKLRTLNCAVTGFFANKDQWITTAIVEQYKKDMETAGKKLTVYSYDAEHAFANPSNPKFDKRSAEDAMQKAVAFFKGNFR